MRNRLVPLLAATAIAVATLAGCAPAGNKDGGSGSGGGGTYRVLSGYNDSEATMKIFNSIVKKYQEEVNPNFKVEIETVPATNELWEKVRLYLQSDNLPAIFSLSNGPIAEEMIKRELLVNMGDLLKTTGHDTEMSEALRGFFTSKDGNLYMIPSSRAGEFFVYRTATFKKYGLQPPKTWDDFLKICDTLKKAGEDVYVMRGIDAVMYLRFVSFPTWTTSGDKFITSLINKETSYNADPAAVYGAELLKKLGDGGYFVPGYESLNMGDAIDAFVGGTGAMTYANTGFIPLLTKMYDAGEVGYFGAPVVAGMDSTGSTFPQHGGKSWAVNKKAYDNDPVLQDFMKFYLDNVDAQSYANGALSWMDSKIPDGALDKMTSDIGAELQKQKTGWVSWDDKLQPATLTVVSDSAAKLAKQAITPEEFGRAFDDAIKANNG